MKLYCDNKTAITHNPVQHYKTKQVKIDKHFIKEKLEASVVCMSFVPTTKQIYDILTNRLLKPNL